MESLGYRIVSNALEIGEIFFWRQFAEIGIDWRTMEKWILEGFLEHRSRGVYQVPGPITPERLLNQAVAILPRAVVSHEAAGKIHGLEGFDSDELVVTVHASATHKFEGVRVVRNRDLYQIDLVEIGGVVMTTPLRTVLDTALLNGYEVTRDLLDDGRKAGEFTLDDVRSLYARVCGRGKPGSAHFRRYIQEHRWDPAGDAVERAVERLQEAGLPAPTRGVRVPWEPRHVFSLAYPGSKVALKLIGSSGKHPGWDDRYSRMLTMASNHGWSLLLVSNTDIELRSQALAAQIRMKLKQREPL